MRVKNLYFLYICLFSSVSLCWAQERLPDRPSDSGVLPERPSLATSLDFDFVEQVYEYWERDRNPTIFVTMGLQQDRTIRYGLRSPMLDRIRLPLNKELKRAFDNGLVMPEIRQLIEGNVIANLERDIGTELSPEASTVLKQKFNADIVLDIVFLNGTERGRYAVSLTAYDTRTATQVASQSLLTTAQDISVARGTVVGVAIAKSFAEQYLGVNAAVAGRRRSTTFELKVLGEESEDGLNSRALRRIAFEIEELPGVGWAEADWASHGDEGFATLQVRYRGRLASLLLDIEEEILPTFELSWQVQQSTGDTAVVLIGPESVPGWYAVTNEGAEDFDETKSNRVRTIRHGYGGLRLGVIVARGLDNDFPQLEISGAVDQGEGIDLDPASLRTAVQDMFIRLGFDVRDDIAVRQRLSQIGRAMDRRGISELDLEALADLDAFDLLAVVGLRVSDDERPQVNARLILRSDAQLLSGVIGPNEIAFQQNRFRIDPTDESDLARYVVGSLVTRFDEVIANAERSMDVTIANLDDSSQFESIMRLFEKLPGVSRVGRVGLSLPVGSFEVFIDQKLSVDFSSMARSSLERGLVKISYSPVLVSMSPSAVFIDAGPEKNSPMPFASDEPTRISKYPPPFPEFTYRPPEGAIEVGMPGQTTSVTPEPLPEVVPESEEGPPPPVRFKAQEQKNSWAILIGVNESAIATPLNACVSDAKRLVRALVDDAGFPRSQVILMTDEQAGTNLEPTKENIFSTIEKVIGAIALTEGGVSEHKVIFSISTHGGADEATGKTNLVARDELFYLEDIRARFVEAGIHQSIFFADACQTGGPNDAKFYDSLQVSNQTTLAGSRRDQASLEKPGPPPFGLMTQSIVYGLAEGAADKYAGNDDGILDLFELYKFSYDYVVRESEGRQNPFLKVVANEIPVISRSVKQP